MTAIAILDSGETQNIYSGPIILAAKVISGFDIAASGPKTFAVVGREVLEEISRVFFLHLLGASNDNQPTGETFLLHFGSRNRRSLGD
jgi:hypothetical protein